MKDRAMRMFSEYYGNVVGFYPRLAAYSTYTGTYKKSAGALNSASEDRQLFMATITLKNIDEGRCCRLTTSLSNYLADMSTPKGFTVAYTGPDMIGFRYAGNEYLASRIDLELKGWMVIGSDMTAGWFLDTTPAIGDYGTLYDEDAKHSADRLLYLLQNFTIAWQHGLLLEGAASDGSDAVPTSSEGSRASKSGERYIHLGKRATSAYEAQNAVLAAWSSRDSTYRALNWLVRSYFRMQAGRVVEVVAHERHRDPDKLVPLSEATITL